MEPPTIFVSTIRPQEADCTGLQSGESLKMLRSFIYAAGLDQLLPKRLISKR
jgi:hypothetical protein